MKFSARFPLLVIIALTIVPSSGFASMRKFLSRLEYSYSSVNATARMSGSSELYDPISGTYISDQKVLFTRNISARTGYGVGSSVFFPLKRLGRSSIMALSVETNESFFIWGNLNAAYTTTGNFYTGGTDVFGATVQMAAPIGVDFKYGCDALASKSHRFCATAGVGVVPSLNGTIISATNYDGGGLGFGVNPYIKAEAGVRAGFCWKFRLMFAFGNLPYISGKGDFSDGNIKLTGKTQTTLSFVIMPFAFLWKKSSWADRPFYN